MKRKPEVTHRIMSAVHSKDTEPERLLAIELWKLGLRYRKHHNVAGKPDFAFPGVKLAVFVDGDFWHGHNWKIRGMRSLDEELSTYSDFWRKKILKNVERDKEVDEILTKEGWRIIRIFESEVRDSPADSANRVQANYKELKAKFR